MDSKLEGDSLTALKAIREFCVECTGGDLDWIKSCPSKACKLHTFRLGKNPNISEETRAKHSAAAKARGFGKK